jgi:hypothetical protein
MKKRPIPTTIARPAVRAVRTKSGITAGHACDPGLTRSTPTTAHNGLLSSHIAAGATIATAAPTRASIHV